MSEEMIPVRLDQPMNFDCSSKNDCFNECCRDLSQALTPYDVVRMKNNLKITSQVFLREYTTRHTGPESGLPMIEFKANPQTGHACPFVKADGCSIYQDRPASCRMYPLARAVTRSRETGRLTEFFARIEEPHCKGFIKENTLTVRQWLRGQNVEKHNRNNDKLMELLSLKNRIIPGIMDPLQADYFYLALYDTDEFKHRIENNDLPAGDLPTEEMCGKILSDDAAILDFAMIWLKQVLFGIQPQSLDSKGG